MKENEICKWTVRPGTNNSFWAYTPCKPGFNPLTRVSKVSEIESAYNNKLCPICNKSIRCNLDLVKDEPIEI